MKVCLHPWRHSTFPSSKLWILPRRLVQQVLINVLCSNVACCYLCLLLPEGIDILPALLLLFDNEGSHVQLIIRWIILVFYNHRIYKFKQESVSDKSLTLIMSQRYRDIILGVIMCVFVCAHLCSHTCGSMAVVFTLLNITHHFKALLEYSVWYLLLISASWHSVKQLSALLCFSFSKT